MFWHNYRPRTLLETRGCCYVMAYENWKCPILHMFMPLDIFTWINWANKHTVTKSHTEKSHYSGVIMSGIPSQITGFSIAFSTVCSGADQRKYQSSVPLAFVRGIHRSPVDSPHKGPVTRKMTSSCPENLRWSKPAEWLLSSGINKLKKSLTVYYCMLLWGSWLCHYTRNTWLDNSYDLEMDWTGPAVYKLY